MDALLAAYVIGAFAHAAWVGWVCEPDDWDARRFVVVTLLWPLWLTAAFANIARSFARNRRKINDKRREIG